MVSVQKLTFITVLLTSVISFKAVSVPRLKSLPGTLLLMVQGITMIGIQNASYFSLASASCTALWYAWS